MTAKTSFVIMPFGKFGTPDYESSLRTYREMIKPALERNGFRVLRADEISNGGNITRDIIRNLNQADLVVADLTGWNANVFYELGVRHALRPHGTVMIARQGESLPFDIANYRTIYYTHGSLANEAFATALALRIATIPISDGVVEPDNPVHDALETGLRTQFVQSGTGSRIVTSGRVGHRSNASSSANGTVAIAKKKTHPGVVADAGAVQAVMKGRRLLPVGVLELIGPFQPGDSIHIYNELMTVVGTGRANFPSDVLDHYIGKRSTEIPREVLLRYGGAVVSREAIYPASVESRRGPRTR